MRGAPAGLRVTSPRELALATPSRKLPGTAPHSDPGTRPRSRKTGIRGAPSRIGAGSVGVIEVFYLIYFRRSVSLRRKWLCHVIKPKTSVRLQRHFSSPEVARPRTFPQHLIHELAT